MYRQLVYLSTSSVPMDSASLLQLLEKARAKNAARGVSGMLLYADRAFVQVLEGPSGAVEDIFAAIEADKRHAGVKIVQDAAVEQRDFADWAMAFKTVDGTELAGIHGLQQLSRKAVTSLAGGLSQPVARVFIRQFAESGYRW